MKYNPIFTGAHAEHEFCIWNKVAFDLQLRTMPTFRHPEEIDGGETLALFEGLDDGGARISIARSAVSTPIEYSALMLHEMVHQLQHELDLPLEHDEFFDAKAAEIFLLTGIEPR